MLAQTAGHKRAQVTTNTHNLTPLQESGKAGKGVQGICVASPDTTAAPPSTLAHEGTHTRALTYLQDGRREGGGGHAGHPQSEALVCV